MISNIENKLKFIELLDEMKYIERAIYLKNGRKENDAEHSYHLASIICIFAGDFPHLNIENCIKMALFHDLVEIFAGDTVILDDTHQKTKQEREKQALIQIEAVVGEECFFDIKQVIGEYELQESEESRFVYQLDKLHPMIQNVIKGDGNSWQEYKMEKNKILEKKYSTIDDEFGLRKILDIYIQKAEEKNMFYEGENK